MLIGTHRVLSRDVVPKTLGLVIVDEEQRFGVAQKELLRALRLEVDVLSLSATPIPRTLHMSLAGLRDISVIATPPADRKPIRTHVGEWDEELVALAVRREHDRGGQTFYLHNRVETIDEAAEKLRRLVPEVARRRRPRADARRPARGGHARVPARRPRRPVLDHDHRVRASTSRRRTRSIVERADMLGLAQAYQIRGRVGRSERTAHAYLLYPDGSELSAEARARLATLADHTELGSGYRIAMRDLELRGAGNLLGDEQSGHVAAVGFELYCEMLAEAVEELSGTRLALARPVRVDAGVDAYVPPDLRPARGGEDRRAPPDRAGRVGRRPARAANRARGSLRAAAGTRRQPAAPAGGAAQARAPRGGLRLGPRRRVRRSESSSSDRPSCGRSATS